MGGSEEGSWSTLERPAGFPAETALGPDDGWVYPGQAKRWPGTTNPNDLRSVGCKIN